MTTESNTASASGYSATKTHWQQVRIHGTRTSCNKFLSYSGEDSNSFYHTLKNYPELTCKKCAAKFREYAKQQLDRKNKR